MARLDDKRNNMHITPSLISIQHRPYGDEHPYQQSPDERFPRHPLARQPVILGVQTFPAGSATKVWATWSMNKDSKPSSTEGKWIENKDGDSLWHVNLPTFERGDHVKYKLHAADKNNVLDTPIFFFSVLDWRSSGEVIDLRRESNLLDITFAKKVNLPETHLIFKTIDQGILNCTLTLGNRLTNPIMPSNRINHSDSQDDPSKNNQVENNKSFLWGNKKDNLRNSGGIDFYPIKEIKGECLLITNGNIQILIEKKPFKLRIQKNNGQTILEQEIKPEWLFDSDGNLHAVRMSYSSPSGEGFYGFGERYNSLNQCGNRLDIRVYDEYKNQGLRTYIPVPFFISSHNYGFFLKTARRVVFDLCNSNTKQWGFEVEMGDSTILNFDIYANKTPLENLRAFFAQTEKPTLPPSWVFGPWMSSNEWNSQRFIVEQVANTKKYDIPATVIVIEAWSDESTFYIWNDAIYHAKPGDCSFSYNEFTFPQDGLWPNPKGMIEELHKQGIRVILWQIPVMRKLENAHPQHDADARFMQEKKYYIQNQDGSPYLVQPSWFQDSMLLDFSNPNAVKWWMDKRKYLLDEIGADGFKTDGGEHIWSKNVIFANGIRGDEGINLYSNLYIGAYHRFALQYRNGDSVTFSRSGFTNSQAFPCHWAGDENSSWQAFQSSLYAGLNAGLSGIIFWGWDIGGFGGLLPTAELYLRAAAMAVFCPIMQYHSEFNDHRQPCNDRTPWNIAFQTGKPEVTEIYSRFAHLRMKLQSYILTEAKHCSQSGEPLMRPLFLDWPDDPLSWKIIDEYCFGRSLLIAPVMQPDSETRKVYLPSGEWEDFWDHRKIPGNQWIIRNTPLDIIPVYRRLDRTFNL